MLCWTRYLLLGLLILVLVFTLVEVALLLMRQGGFQSERGEKEEGHSVLLLWLQQLAQQTDAAFYPPQQQAASSPPLDGQTTAATDFMGVHFNWTKCAPLPNTGLGSWRPKVYVPPADDETDLLSSVVYQKILTAIREGPHHTGDPDEACLFVLGIDTIDRDKLSENYTKDMRSLMAQLPVWAGGRNHILFNHFCGTYPNYFDTDLGFDVGHAMVARASGRRQEFRDGFDISFPLFHRDHPVHVEDYLDFKSADPHHPTQQQQQQQNQQIQQHQYLASFKGKRYVYGGGSETRAAMRHLHNGETVVVALTCRHNTDWQLFEDGHCAGDNAVYDRWDYMGLMRNSTFCFIPRGRRLGTFRFLEALSVGCIPVVLSDDWVLPFDELIDWSRAVVFAHERSVLFVHDRLWPIPVQQLVALRSEGMRLYRKHFSSVENIVNTVFEIVFSRIRKTNAAAAAKRHVGK